MSNHRYECLAARLRVLNVRLQKELDWKSVKKIAWEEFITKTVDEMHEIVHMKVE